MDGPPADYQELRRRLEARAASLPKRLRQVAEFALRRPDDVAFGSTASVAELAAVQPSTIVRFAQALGLAGFSELQALFQARLRGGFPDYQDRVAALAGEASRTEPAALLDGFARSAIASLERLRDAASSDALDASVATLGDAETIYLVGVRRVFPVVAYLAYAFGKLGVRTSLIDHVAQLGPEQMAHAGERDAVLAVSFTPYAPATMELASLAARQGAPIIAITDSPFSPLVGVAQAWLEVAEADFAGFRSLSASVALALTLAVAVAERRRAAR